MALTESNRSDELPESPPRAGINIDDAGWLVGNRVTRVKSARYYEKLVTSNGCPDAIVWHWTATKHGTGRALAERIRKLPPKGQGGSSWHICIDADGSIYQSVSFLNGSWHAGGPTARRLTGNKTANFSAVGIELVNLGRLLHCIDGEIRAWPFLKPGHQAGPIVKEADAFDVGEKRDYAMYHKFTPQQLDAAQAVHAALNEEYGELKNYSHQELDPTRKEDPGPWFMELVNGGWNRG